MKVIFLDIDGVLNCASTENPRKFPYIADPKLNARLKQLLQKTDAKVVLSSTWRYDPIGLLAARYYGIPFIDVTPDLPSRPRRDEILQWLSDHPNVDRYIVIDDDNDLLDELPLFQPSAKTGITDDIVEQAADYLNGRSDKDVRRAAPVRLLQNVTSALSGHQG